jgi:hypothetical protein
LVLVDSVQVELEEGPINHPGWNAGAAQQRNIQRVKIRAIAGSHSQAIFRAPHVRRLPSLRILHPVLDVVEHPVVNTAGGNQRILLPLSDLGGQLPYLVIDHYRSLGDQVLFHLLAFFVGQGPRRLAFHIHPHLVAPQAEFGHNLDLPILLRSVFYVDIAIAGRRILRDAMWHVRRDVQIPHALRVSAPRQDQPGANLPKLVLRQGHDQFMPRVEFCRSWRGNRKKGAAK